MQFILTDKKILKLFKNLLYREIKCATKTDYVEGMYRLFVAVICRALQDVYIKTKNHGMNFNKNSTEEDTLEDAIAFLNDDEGCLSIFCHCCNLNPNWVKNLIQIINLYFIDTEFKKELNEKIIKLFKKEDFENILEDDDE